jgi:ketosteroid isomerase-like protein
MNKIHFLALVGLASFVVPAFAPQEISDETHQQLALVGKTFHDGFNNQNAAAVASVYTEDAVSVTDTGPIYGRAAIQKHLEDVFQKIKFSDHTGKADHEVMVGNEVWSNGEWSSTIQGTNWGPLHPKGYWMVIWVREGDAWKFKYETWNVNPTSVASPTAAGKGE